MITEQRERLPVSVSSAVFIEDEQGRLLFLQQASEAKNHRWGPPAGGLEAHENPIAAAVREVKEEIGVDVALLNLVGIYTADRGEKASGLGFVFRGTIVSGDITLRKQEVMDYRFFSIGEIESLIKKDLLYKPEYNIPCIEDWKNGLSFPLGVIK